MLTLPLGSLLTSGRDVSCTMPYIVGCTDPYQIAQMQSA